MTTEEIKNLAVNALEDIKAENITCLDVKGLTSITDYMIICSGTSSRHIKSLSQNVVKSAKSHDLQPLGVEGEQHSDWVLVDLGDVIVHIMLPDVRLYYDLEKLWGEELAVG